MTEKKELGHFNIGSENLKKTEKEQPKKAELNEKWVDTSYRKYYQGNATNSLADTYIFRKPPEQAQLELFRDGDKDTLKTTIVIDENFSISFINPATDMPLVLSQGAKQLLTAMTLKFTEQVDNKLARAGKLAISDLSIVIPLRTYAEMIGYKTDEESLRNLRKKVRKEMNELYSISIHYEGNKESHLKKDKKRTDVGAYDYIDARILGKKGEFSNGNIELEFSGTFGDYLGRSYQLLYPMSLLRISTQQSPLPQFIGYILVRQNNIPSDTIGVRTIIEKAIKSGLLPSIEEQRKKGELKRRFITPIEKALDKLYEGGVITDWGYTKGKRQKLTDRERESTSFDDLLNMYIFFDMPTPETLRKGETKKNT